MDKFPVGRIRELLAFGKGMHQKVPIVSVRDIADEIRFRGKSLDVDIGAFSGIVGDIGVDFFFDVVLGNRYLGFQQEKSDNVYSRNVQSISELRREKYLGFLNLLKMYPLGSFLVGIYPGNASVGKELFEILLHLLYPETDTVEIVPVALGATVRQLGLSTAMVTEEFAGRGGMDDHREVAAFAHELVPAVLAQERTSRPPAIEEQEALLSSLDRLGDLFHEFVRQEGEGTAGIVEVYDGEHIVKLLSTPTHS